jgi:adenylate cyclase
VKDESDIDWESYSSVILPVPELVKSAKGLGNVMMIPDDDGIYRRVPLVSAYGGRLLPSLPLAVAVDVLDVQEISLDPSRRLHLDRIAVPLQEDGSMLVKYHGAARTYKYYSIASLIQSLVRLEEGAQTMVEPDEFRDKIVLVGLTAAGLFDLKPSPFSSVYPGVEVHATVLDNILREDFLTRTGTATLVVMIFGLSVICGVGVSHSIRLRISLPLVALCASVPLIIAVVGFKGGFWLDLVAPEAAILATFGLTSIISYSTEGRQRRFIKNAFKHYLSPSVIDELVKNPERLELGGERRELTVLFSDVAGFTALSERLRPEEVSELLCEYLSEMARIILSTGGTLDKYEGDAIMAFWGAPLHQPDHARRACRAALGCQTALVEIREDFEKRGWPQIFARIGINSGEMVVGNMGSRERFDYTVLGDNVNLGSRLEGANKEFSTEIMISESTYRLVKNEMEARELDVIRVKGKETPVRVYELLQIKGHLDDEAKRTVAIFQKGLSLYRQREWEEARKVFREISQDPPASVFVERCERLLESPPSDDWDGVYTLSTK